MMTTNSKQKGNRGELEIANYLKDRGYKKARRGQQYCGIAGDADVVGVPGLHIEVKRMEKSYPYKWLDQAEGDKACGETAVVFHRQNKKEWIAILSMDDFMELYEAAQVGFASKKEWDKESVNGMPF